MHTKVFYTYIQSAHKKALSKRGLHFASHCRHQKNQTLLHYTNHIKTRSFPFQ